MRTVRQVLDKKGNDVFSVPLEASVKEASKKMADKKVGALLVMEGNDLKGIVSERDFAWKVIREGKRIEETPVRAVMTSEVTSIGPEYTLEDGIELMTKKKVRHLPVIENDKVIGVVSAIDMMKAALPDLH